MALSTTGMQACQQTHFRFLDLPPELRNLVYSFVADEVGDKVIRPIAKSRHPTLSGPNGVVVTKAKREHTSLLGLLLANKQVYSEVSTQLQSAIHGEVYWPSAECAAGRDAERCSDCGVYHLGTSNEALIVTLETFRPQLKQIVHLDLRGSGALSFEWEMLKSLHRLTMAETDMSKYGSCRLFPVRTRKILNRLKEPLQNVESLTYFLDVDDQEDVLSRAQYISSDDLLMEFFPKLKEIRMDTEDGMLVLWRGDTGVAGRVE